VTRDDENVTQQQPLPPHETTASPVEMSVAMPRYFGVTPPTLLFGIATATLAIAIVLAILAHWIAALVLAALVLVELALFVSLARRKPDTAVAKASVRTLTRARERAAWLVRSTSVRTEAGRRLTRLRHELLELDGVHERKLRDLGRAVYAGDDVAAESVKGELAGLDDERQRKEGEMRAIEEAARQDLERGRLHVQPTAVKPPVEDESRSPSGS
jgi:type IV secretory pathway VirB3-like protein